MGNTTKPNVNSASKCFGQKVHSLKYFRKFQHFAEGVDARKNSISRFLEWGLRTQQLIHPLLWTLLVTFFECFSKNVKYWILIRYSLIPPSSKKWPWWTSMLCEGKSWPKQLLSDAVKRQTVSGRCQNGPFHLLVAELEHTRQFFCQSIFP